ncbi:MAG: hypothetical protein LBF74_07415 [Treponema sp.]|jgi:hypothetical protein|nr:hypothetical protein [Treponema sp.]
MQACPFCDSPQAVLDTLKYRSGKPFCYRGKCLGCGAVTRWCETEEKAWAAWNTRPQGQCLPEAAQTAFICKDLFFFKGAMYARNPETEFCYTGGKDGYRRMRKADYLVAYAECAKAAGRMKG